MVKQKKKILIVEDDKFLIKAYEIKFKKEGFDIMLAGDGMAGLEMAQKNPDLVILDLMLPKLNGFEFLETIKKDEKLKNIPVIVLSNLGQKADMDRVMLLGAADYLVKTEYSLEEIIKKVEKYIE